MNKLFFFFKCTYTTQYNTKRVYWKFIFIEKLFVIKQYRAWIYSFAQYICVCVTHSPCVSMCWFLCLCVFVRSCIYVCIAIRQKAATTTTKSSKFYIWTELSSILLWFVVVSLLFKVHLIWIISGECECTVFDCPLAFCLGAPLLQSTCRRRVHRHIDRSARARTHTSMSKEYVKRSRHRKKQRKEWGRGEGDTVIRKRNQINWFEHKIAYTFIGQNMYLFRLGSTHTSENEKKQ